jgi:hypothetical protein
LTPEERRTSRAFGQRSTSRLDGNATQLIIERLGASDSERPACIEPIGPVTRRPIDRVTDVKLRCASIGAGFRRVHDLRVDLYPGIPASTPTGIRDSSATPRRGPTRPRGYSTSTCSA